MLHGRIRRALVEAIMRRILKEIDEPRVRWDAEARPNYITQGDRINWKGLEHACLNTKT